MRRLCVFLPFILLILLGSTNVTRTFVDVCPGLPIQPRGPDFAPGGIILTAFDKSGIWVYNIDRDTRYPLPDTRPCNRQCRLSPDAQWITYVNPVTDATTKMRLDGTQRSVVAEYAHDVEWWPDNRLLIWTPDHHAYWENADHSDQTELDVSGVTSVQPGGEWGLLVEQNGDDFSRGLIDLQTRDLQGIAGGQIPLGKDVPYFDASAWSPDGSAFAYVAPGTFDPKTQIAGAELYLIHPGDPEAEQLTNLYQQYGAVRINGGIRASLSWSPDGSQIAFWVIELLGPDYESQTGNAVIHIVDTRTGTTRAYCGFSTTEHTPDPPLLRWSPDGTSLAFGGNVPGDDKGYLLLALNSENGVFTELSNGIYPVLGTADVIAWGLP
jgi:hypothetical protein